jgi:formylglycine-generating enzyme required for sulfatase activity
MECLFQASRQQDVMSIGGRVIALPLPRPKLIRIIATQDGDSWRVRVSEALKSLDEPVAIDTSAAEERLARKPVAAVLVWTRDTSDSASAFREVGECDRRNVNVHILDTGESPILGAIEGLAQSTHTFTDGPELRKWLNETVLGAERSPPSGTGQDLPTSSFADAVRVYLSFLSERLRTVDVVGQRVEMDIEDVYLPLRLQDLDPASSEGGPTTLLELLITKSRVQRLFLVGTPGAGKSTLLSYTALQVAHRSLADDVPCVPLVMRAKDLVELNYSSLLDYIRAVVKGCVKSGGSQISGVMTHSEEFGGPNTQLLIDGVDELKRDDRQRLRQLVRIFETEYPDATVTLCSRPNGYDPTLWEGYRKMMVLPLEVLSARQYVEKFADSSNRERLLALLSSSERLRELAQVPFMLALMCSYEGNGSGLPLRRAGLIQACVKSLLRRRPLSGTAGLDHDDLEMCLANVSERLFRLNSSGGHGESEFVFALQACIAERPTRAPMVSAADQAMRALDEIIERTGLLQRDGDDIDFVHRSIWEYFVAVALGWRELEALDDVAGAPAWEEPIRLMIGLAPERRVHLLMSRLWGKNPALALRAAAESAFRLERRLRQLLSLMPPGEAAALVRDLGVLLDDRTARGANERLVLDTLQVLLPEAKNCEVLWEGLNVLLRVGDREEEARELLLKVFRFDEASHRLERLIATDASAARFVSVSSGKFLMGNDSEGRSVDEGPSHVVQVSTFSISATTVTNATRQLFPFEIGSEDDARSPTDAHPMIGVTWYEAIVLAIWFGCRLPTEAEWEYACRAGGHDDFQLFDEVLIPEYAWYAGNAENMTHPVGGLRPNSFDLYDMLGNVREWCWDWFSGRYYAECAHQGTVTDPLGPGTGSQKVLRGGCFDWNTANLVPTYRNSNLPNNRGFQNGVRLVRGMPSFLARYSDIAQRSDQHPD